MFSKQLKEELEARRESVSGNKAWLRRRLHAAILCKQLRRERRARVQREWGGRERVREVFGADDSDARSDATPGRRDADGDFYRFEAPTATFTALNKV